MQNLIRRDWARIFFCAGRLIWNFQFFENGNALLTNKNGFASWCTLPKFRPSTKYKHGTKIRAPERKEFIGSDSNPWTKLGFKRTRWRSRSARWRCFPLFSNTFGTKWIQTDLRYFTLRRHCNCYLFSYSKIWSNDRKQLKKLKKCEKNVVLSWLDVLDGSCGLSGSALPMADGEVPKPTTNFDEKTYKS